MQIRPLNTRGYVYRLGEVFPHPIYHNPKSRRRRRKNATSIENKQSILSLSPLFSRLPGFTLQISCKDSPSASKPSSPTPRPKKETGGGACTYGQTIVRSLVGDLAKHLAAGGRFMIHTKVDKHHHAGQKHFSFPSLRQLTTYHPTARPRDKYGLTKKKDVQAFKT